MMKPWNEVSYSTKQYEGTWTEVVSEVKQTRICKSTKEMQVAVIITMCSILGKLVHVIKKLFGVSVWKKKWQLLSELL